MHRAPLGLHQGGGKEFWSWDWEKAGIYKGGKNIPKQTAVVYRLAENTGDNPEGAEQPLEQRCATGLGANWELGALSVPIVCLILTGAAKDLSL